MLVESECDFRTVLFPLLDDVIEGFLMRFLRGSGITGLAGMNELTFLKHPHHPHMSVTIFRPFLSHFINSVFCC